MDTLTPLELRQALEFVVQLAACPVCQETLTPKVVLCVRGHAICESHHQQLLRRECPLCRSPFSNVQPTGFIRQVIESLPHPCRYNNCDYFVKTSDDHEQFCTCKPTICHYCHWSGSGKDLVQHLKTDHDTVRKYLLPILGILENGTPFNPKNEGSVFTPILVDGHFFWGEMKNEPIAGKLTAIFHPVAIGKTTTVFKGSVKLSLRGSYSADIKLNTHPEVDAYVENCISIPTSILHKYTVEDKFEYRLTIDIIRLESLVTLSQSWFKSGIELLKFRTS